MNWLKKISIRIFIFIYGASFFLQNSFFVDRKKIYAAENPSTTNLVAVFVDKEIYKDITTNLIRYTTQYIQKKIANSKAIVLPIDTTTLQAHEISQILENIYFEWLKDQSSKLVGTVLIGNIPLPVVENNGFLYPSIFPYVDFEEQQFIYNTNKQFFVYNDNPNGQAELWHGIIKFDTHEEYNTFFTKLRSYHNNPTKFIDKAIRYDDFIGTKKYFIAENTKYYINSMIFWEDIGYHRYNSLLLDTLTSEHNDEVMKLNTTLGADMQNVKDADLKTYGQMIQERGNEANINMNEINAELPTLTLKKSTQEMLKTYDGLISSMFLSKIKDNIAWLARRYKNTDGQVFTDVNGTTDKINQQDNWILGDSENDMPPLLIQINERLEKWLNDKIEEEKYYMNIPIPISELNLKWGIKIPVLWLPKCIRETYDYYENYYFGKHANFITNAQEASSYRWTYQNLDAQALTEQNIPNPLQSIGWSYKVFSTQIDANRGYNIGNAQEELDLYNILKINKQELWKKDCNLQLFGYCFRWKKTWKADDSDDEDKCFINDEEKQWWCESITGFSQRLRGGASPLNLDENISLDFNYKDAKLPIYDIAWSKKITNSETNANSYLGVENYASIMQTRFAVEEKMENKFNDVFSYINRPTANGIDLKFTNQKPTNIELNEPIRWYNASKTYAQNNFFTVYNTMPYRTITGGKYVLYNRNNSDNSLDILNCGIKSQIYTYKTIDSRVKNIAPTWDQISNTEFYKFKDNAPLEVFYTSVIQDLSGVQTEILEKNIMFSGTSTNDMTGVVSNLLQVKKLVASGNAGMAEISTFNHSTLLGQNTTWINNKANDRSEKNLNQTKILELSRRIQNINKGLDERSDYIDNISINNTLLSIDNSILSEQLKQQNIEILDTWKTHITQNLDEINTNINILKWTFTNAKNIYDSTEELNNSYLSSVITKKNQITNLHTGDWCTTTYYKAICNVLDTIINTLNTNITGTTSTINYFNEEINKIKSYTYTNDDEVKIIKPFLKMNLSFTELNVSKEILQAKAKINRFDISNNPDKIEINKWMNITTQDRPIDNIRNITFKGIGWDKVQFNYPNIYEVEVYKEVNNVLILKTPTEIKEAIKTYLVNKANEYNVVLTQQKNKKNSYYTSFSSQFNLLAQLDPLATPNRTYNLIPTNYFINKTIEFLDKLEATYTKTYLYGKNNPNTDEEKLNFLGKFFYQQNIARPEKIKTNTVEESIKETKSSFDINKKVSNIVQNYLQTDNDQGKFLMPTYNTTWYEVGFINSDGNDYISAKADPTLIQVIKWYQEKNETTPTKNQFIEDPTQRVALQNSVDLCEGIDINWAALIVDFTNFSSSWFKAISSPWFNAMKCRTQKIAEKPFDIKIGFDNALGPVFLGTIESIATSFKDSGKQRKKYGEQRAGPNNQENIDQATGKTKQILESYNTYALPKFTTTTINLDNPEKNQIRLGMMQDVWDINVKISATGDNCFGIKRGNKIISQNICNKEVREYYNPNNKEILFDLIIDKKTAGSTSVQIQLCTVPILEEKEHCITKSEVIHTLPWAIKTIKLKTESDIVMEWSYIPLNISAEDAYGNMIGQSTQSYIIDTNHGKISDGATSANSITFDNFNTKFIYEAPTGLTDNKAINITITENTEKRLTNETTNIPPIKKNIITAKGIITVSENTNIMYKTNTVQNTGQKIEFDLPQQESNIQYIDEHNLAQINKDALPKIQIQIQDKYGNKLTTIANIRSKNNLLNPGILVEKTTKNISQTLFRNVNEFMIKDGKLEVYLYPNFKAGDDILTINIPGIDPIILAMTINPGTANKVILTLEKSKMNLTTSTESKWTISVIDNWNNAIKKATNIKLWIAGEWATTANNDIVYTGGEFTYTITSKKPWWEWFVFAYIKDKELKDQIAGYQKFIVQDKVLPEENLNIMYLNIFGTDRWNQWGYFSENKNLVNTMTKKSEKLLATTTQLIDPTKIKQIPYITHPHGQIQSLHDDDFYLTIQDKNIIAQLPEIAEIHLWESKNFTIKTIENREELSNRDKTKNTFFYLPEPIDSIITENTSDKNKITVNKQTALDLKNGTISNDIIIDANHERQQGMQTYTVYKIDKKIGNIRISSQESIDEQAITILDPMTYGKIESFSQWSTNTKGIGIYLKKSNFSKNWYLSIEDSADSMLGIWFTNKFKNIANFANGQTVGEATLPYGSHFLVNFWDPMLKRTEKNENIPDNDFDASIGEQIYTDPNKTILKTAPIDFNKNGLQDLLIIYTDGTVKLLKNHWGTHPYKNLQQLMIITESIKEVHIGDVDGNNYDDIIIITKNNKWIVYLNDKWMFPVDGKNICLNTNTEPGTQSNSPENFGNIEQLFVQDMNNDGKVDIVTNDKRNDIKIFYGGSTNGWANYISQNNGTCDNQWYERQKENYKTIKHFGIKINPNRYIQDQSLVHRKWLIAPVEWKEEEIETIAEEEEQELTLEELKELKELKNTSKTQIESFMAELNNYIELGAAQLAYINNPLTTIPSYENSTVDDIYYLPINKGNDSISVYKEYQDINGDILRHNDEVVVKTTILSKKNNNKINYIDVLQWPRKIKKDDNRIITSLVFITGNTWWVEIDRNVPEEYQFSLDNIQLGSGDTFSFSYTVSYQHNNIINIDINDEESIEHNKEKDWYLDISAYTTDACQKNSRILFNEKVWQKKSYEEIFDNIQNTLDQYNAEWSETQNTALNDILTKAMSINNVDDIWNIPWANKSLENWNPVKWLLQIATGLMIAWGTTNIDMNIIDAATKNVSKKIDEALDGLCQWFVLETKDTAWCKWVPVPFNEAFLAPGDYHIFWCVPKLPNPLFVPFETINKTLGKGLPLLSFPTTLIAPPIPPVPFSAFLWIPAPMGAWWIFWDIAAFTSQFRLYIAPTLTLGLWIAMCFWPYWVGIKLPKPFRDLWGNCVVFALPPITVCPKEPTTDVGPQTNKIDSYLKKAARWWTCNTPSTKQSTQINTTNNESTTIETVSTPFQIVAANSFENTCESCTTNYSPAMPQGNFWWIIQMDQDPITITSVIGETDAYEGYDLKKWEKIKLKVVGAKTKGLVECMIKDWTTRQLLYIKNNLTQMTIQVDLPDVSTVFQWFDKIGNVFETYAELNEQDIQAGTIQTQKKDEDGNKIKKSRDEYLSKKSINSFNEKIGSNPFEAIESIFSEVPLINIGTQTINIKIPALTSDDLNSYKNYLDLRIEENIEILNNRGEMLTGMMQTCNSKKIKEIDQKIEILEEKKNINNEERKELLELQKLKEKCEKLKEKVYKFLVFKENSEGMIRAVQQNKQVLEEYKKFPIQLYERTHYNDRFITELSALLSSFVGDIMYRLNTISNRYSQYIDAITTLVWVIKTRQVIVDFSVNRSEKCSKCSNDNYWSFWCSLSFLCPKLPIFPIPTFKIPSIYMDMSHIELGIDILLPKINFVPNKIALPHIPNLPEPPTLGIDIDWNIDMVLPSIPILPAPPKLPEPPSFIPSIKMELPMLPPAPKIPNIIPEINGVLKVAEFIGKVFCIIKWWIWLVGEKWIKGKIEQLTQRTRNVPVFDYFDITTKFQDPPLQWFDYKFDAYATLKFNFDGVYDILNSIASTTNTLVSEATEVVRKGAIDMGQAAIDWAKDKLKDAGINVDEIGSWIESWVDFIENTNFNPTIQINFNDTDEKLTDYLVVNKELKAGLLQLEQSTLQDKKTQNEVQNILAIANNTSDVKAANKEISEIEQTAQKIIKNLQKENKNIQDKIKNYDNFINEIKEQNISLVAQNETSTILTTPLFTIDNTSKQILHSQEDPTQSYLSLNKKMVDGYLYAVNNDGPEKLNMTQSVYNKSKKYLETTKSNIDNALLAYENPLLAQTCTDCSTNTTPTNNTYSTDISAYVQWIFVESYSGTEKSMVNTVTSTEHIEAVQDEYQVFDINNDKNDDILMTTDNAIYVKYGKQKSESRSKNNNSLTTYYNKFYSYANQNTRKRYISSLDQLRENSDAYGFTKISDITIKVIEKNKEIKNFKTKGQNFDTLQIWWKNSAMLGEKIDGYLIKVTKKIDDKDTPNSFRDFLLSPEKPKYLLVLPKDTDYKNILLTIDENNTKRPVNLDLNEKILAIEYYDPANNDISVTFKELPRERLYTSIATLNITQEELTFAQKKSLILYKKSSPWSNQTVAGLQELGDVSGPVGDITLWRNLTKETMSTGSYHEWYINTHYTLKSLRTDNVAVTKMIVQQDGEIMGEKNNDTQTWTLNIEGLFFTGITETTFDFIAIDQNNNITKESVTVSIKIPDIEILNLKKTWEETTEVIAEISHDVDEGMVTFQRLRNGLRKNIEGTNKNTYGWFDLAPKQTIITWDIFTMGNSIGIYDDQGNQIASIDPDTGKIILKSAFANSAKIELSLKKNTPMLEIKNISNNTTLFQIIIPIEEIIDIQMNTVLPQYKKITLQWTQFGDFDGGYCIQNNKNDCILYTSQKWVIYIPANYANNLLGKYTFDDEKKQTLFTITEPTGTPIMDIIVQTKTKIE